MRAVTDLAVPPPGGVQGLGQRPDGGGRDPQRAQPGVQAQILSLAQSRLRAHPDLARLAADVAAGRIDAYAAADRLLSS